MIKNPPTKLPYTLLVSDSRAYPHELVLYYLDEGIYEQVRTNYNDGRISSRDLCDYNAVMKINLWSSSENIRDVDIILVDCPPQITWEVYPENIDRNLGARLWGRILKIADYLLINPKSLNPARFVVSYGVPGGMEGEFHHLPRRLNRPSDISLTDVREDFTYCYIMHYVAV